MKDDHLDPARTVIDKLGGVHAVSQITGRHVSQVYRWMHSREKGGTGGLIPITEAARLLSCARERRVRLVPADFFPAEEEAA